MPLQEFWNDDPDLLWAYRNAYIEKEKQEIEKQKELINLQTWLQGLYNHRAIVSALNKDVQYFPEPISQRTKTKKEENMEIAQRIKARAAKGRLLLEQQRSESKG